MKKKPSLPDSVELEDVKIFRDLSSTERRHIEKYLQEKQFKKGATLFVEGDLCERIFIVKAGRVKIYRVSSSGKEQILEVLNPGETCACNPGAERWTCSSTAEALTDCSLWILARSRYVQMIQNNSRMARSLNRIFAERLCRMSALIEGVSLNDPRKRLVKFLLDMTESAESRCSEPDCICLSMTQEEIAQRLGVTRVTVARHLQQLKAEKLIRIQGHEVFLLDRTALEKIL